MMLWNRMETDERECTSRWLALHAGDGRGASESMKKTWWTEVWHGLTIKHVGY